LCVKTLNDYYFETEGVKKSVPFLNEQVNNGLEKPLGRYDLQGKPDEFIKV